MQRSHFVCVWMGRRPGRAQDSKQLPEMSVRANIGAGAGAFVANENVVNGSIQFTFAIKLTPNRQF